MLSNHPLGMLCQKDCWAQLRVTALTTSLHHRLPFSWDPFPGLRLICSSIDRTSISSKPITSACIKPSPSTLFGFLWLGSHFQALTVLTSWLNFNWSSSLPELHAGALSFWSMITLGWLRTLIDLDKARNKQGSTAMPPFQPTKKKDRN